MAQSDNSFVYGAGGRGLAGNQTGVAGVIATIVVFIVVLALSFLPLLVVLQVYPGGGPDKSPWLASLTANWPPLAVFALALVLVFPLIRLPAEIARLILRGYVDEKVVIAPLAYSHMIPYRVVNWAALAPKSRLTRGQLAMLHLVPFVLTELVLIAVPVVLGSIAVWFACAVSGLNLYMLARKIGLVLWAGRKAADTTYQESRPGTVTAGR